MSLKDRNILVVGASSGIGLSIAKQALAQGANLYTASRSKPEGISPVKHFTLDVKNEVNFDELPNELHGLVYAPGTINLRPFQRLSVEDFQHDLDISLLGAVKVLQAVQNNLRKAKGSSVVLFSTVAVKLGMSFHASVAASKAAVEGLGKSLAAEWANKLIRVNIIAPSLVDTPLAGDLLGSEQKRESSDKRHPIGRVGTPEDIANAAIYALDDSNSWLTGQVIGVDGGMGSLK